MKRIVADHLSGAEGRTKVERWVPRWMAFPPSDYTSRGGVGTVRASGIATSAQAAGIAADESDEPVAAPETADAESAAELPDPDEQTDRLAA